MPIYYERDDAKRRIVATSLGRVTLEHTLGIVDRQAAEGAWSYGVLHDARGTSDLPTADDLHGLVQHVGLLTTQHGPRGPVALVVANPSLYRRGESYADLGALTSLDVRVFASVEEAEAWLSSR